MSSGPADSAILHRRRLDVAMARVREALENQIRGLTPTIVTPPWDGPPAALDVLVSHFGLAPFESDALVMAVGSAINPDIARLCAVAHDDPQQTFPTFALALAALPDGFWNAVSPDRPLRRDRLVELDAHASGPMHARLSAPESVVQFLLGAPTPDPRLSAVTDRVIPPDALLPSQEEAAVSLAAICAQPDAPIVHLVGRPGPTAREVAATAAARLGLAMYALAAETLPSDPAERETLAGIWRRDSRLLGAALLLTFDGGEASSGEVPARLARLADRAGGMVVVAGQQDGEALQRCARPVLRLEAPALSPQEIRDAWRDALGDHADPAQLDRLADQFRFPAPTLRACAAAALAAPDAEAEATPVIDRLWRICRVQGRRRLLGLAQRLPARARFEDLVVPEATRLALEQIVAQHRNRHRVLNDWGFSGQSSRGLGLNAMFEGPSGVGKTMAAEVIASALDLDLFRVDLSAVVDKYIGETEKRLERLFDAAEESGAVLLFDEADALFGRRSQIKDSHDRYANIGVSYLLQRVEDYHGVAILTTNMANAVDTAFLRRLAYVLHFPFPDREQRKEIWRRIFPPDAPTQDLSLERLAQLNMSGGQIRTVALNAAFLASEAEAPVGMGHILQAVRVEYGKLHRTPAAAELAGWPL